MRLFLLFSTILAFFVNGPVFSQDIDVSNVVFTLSITPDERVVALSSATDKYWGNFGITGNYTGEPVYDNKELKPMGAEWQ